MKNKKVWVIVLILVCVWIGWRMKANSKPRVWTAAMEKEAVASCKDWGGHVIRDQNNKYSSCVSSTGEPF